MGEIRKHLQVAEIAIHVIECGEWGVVIPFGRFVNTQYSMTQFQRFSLDCDGYGFTITVLMSLAVLG